MKFNRRVVGRGYAQGTGFDRRQCLQNGSVIAGQGTTQVVNYIEAVERGVFAHRPSLLMARDCSSAGSAGVLSKPSLARLKLTPLKANNL